MYIYVSVCVTIYPYIQCFPVRVVHVHLCVCLCNYVPIYTVFPRESGTCTVHVTIYPYIQCFPKRVVHVPCIYTHIYSVSPRGWYMYLVYIPIYTVFPQEGGTCIYPYIQCFPERVVHVPCIYPYSVVCIYSVSPRGWYMYLVYIPIYTRYIYNVPCHSPTFNVKVYAEKLCLIILIEHC